jgi:hypothetical protein
VLIVVTILALSTFIFLTRTLPTIIPAGRSPWPWSCPLSISPDEGFTPRRAAAVFHPYDLWIALPMVIGPAIGSALIRLRPPVLNDARAHSPHIGGPLP